mmetsp:Transcript_14450/g.36452  ORF Transcript_14450/g.36452 Transcript_14450/m.36452 type:complete len:288 (-) Transcript_14450:54-917(-)
MAEWSVGTSIWRSLSPLFPATRPAPLPSRQSGRLEVLHGLGVGVGDLVEAAHLLVPLPVQGLNPVRHLALVQERHSLGHANAPLRQLVRNQLHLALVEVVVGPREDAQLPVPGLPQVVLREHAADSPSQNLRGVALPLLLHGALLQPARVARVPPVHLVLELAPGQLDVLGVHHHHHVAPVLARVVGGLILPLQDLGQLGGEPPEHETLRVHQAEPQPFHVHVPNELLLVPRQVFLLHPIVPQHVRHLLPHGCQDAARPRPSPTPLRTLRTSTRTLPRAATQPATTP